MKLTLCFGLLVLVRNFQASYSSGGDLTRSPPTSDSPVTKEANPPGAPRPNAPPRYSTMSREQKALYLRIRQAAFASTLFITAAGIFGNLLILATIAKYNSVGVPHVYLQALAVSDFTVSVSSFWKTITERFNHINNTVFIICAYTYWPAKGIDTGASIAASLFATMLSVDRFFALKYPLEHKDTYLVSAKGQRVFVGGLFVLSLVVGICVSLLLSMS
jgi:hypothetical protein